MRLLGQVKQGYFPAPPEAIAGILRHLKIPDPPPDPKFKPEDVNILDPCAGEGKALVQLAEGLGVSPGHVFAVELNASRAARIAEAYPDVRLLGPCSFEATRITRNSFSIVYLNPPFDDEFGGGGREEVKFLRQAVDLLVPGGILVVVCPVNQVYGRHEMCELLDTWFEQIELYLFPDNCRSFRECVVFGRRRKTALPDDHIHTQGVLTSRGIRVLFGRPDRRARSSRGTAVRTSGTMATPDTASRKTELDVWELPFSTAPRRFQKTALTDEELHRELARSPLYERPASAYAVAHQATTSEPQQGPHKPAAPYGHARRLCAQHAAPRCPRLHLESREAPPHRELRDTERRCRLEASVLGITHPDRQGRVARRDDPNVLRPGWQRGR